MQVQLGYREVDTYMGMFWGTTCVTLWALLSFSTEHHWGFLSVDGTWWGVSKVRSDHGGADPAGWDFVSGMMPNVVGAVGGG